MVLSGGEEIVHIGRPVTCESCKGSGAKAGTKPRICTKCGGLGQIVRSQQKAGDTLQHITTCLECGGQGAIIDARCERCGGTGKIAQDETLTVRIPVGVEEGTALRIPGHGQPAGKPGLPPGDLFVIVGTAKDPRFERRGRDLYRVETINVVDAVLGTEIDVPTLDGKVSLKVPAGSQPESILRLHGKGLPRFGGGAPGDLYVRLQVHVPERLSKRQRQLFEQLRAEGDKGRAE
ncbi:DnaJ C-terminal domain-containing protein [Methylocystis sp. IM2]